MTLSFIPKDDAGHTAGCRVCSGSVRLERMLQLEWRHVTVHPLLEGRYEAVYDGGAMIGTAEELRASRRAQPRRFPFRRSDGLVTKVGSGTTELIEEITGNC